MVIQKVLGPLTSRQDEVYNHNPRFVGIKMPDMSKPETLVKRYFGKLSKRALSFMKVYILIDIILIFRVYLKWILLRE